MVLMRLIPACLKMIKYNLSMVLWNLFTWPSLHAWFPLNLPYILLQMAFTVHVTYKNGYSSSTHHWYLRMHFHHMTTIFEYVQGNELHFSTVTIALSYFCSPLHQLQNQFKQSNKSKIDIFIPQHFSRLKFIPLLSNRPI
jgi:hypothetical protein